MSDISSTVVPSAVNPRGGFASSQTRRRSLPQTLRTDADLVDKDRQLADLQVLATHRLAEIRTLQLSATERSRQIDLLLADRDRLTARVEGLTAEMDRLSSELECTKSQAGWPRSRNPSPLSVPPTLLPEHASPLSRHSSPARSTVVTELKQLIENNQVTAKRLKDELNQMSRKSKDEDSAVAGLQNVYRELTNCCTELEFSLHQSSADFDQLFTPHLVSICSVLLQ